MPFQKKCAHCQQPFVNRRRNAKFCSQQCASTVIAAERTVQSDEDVRVYLRDHSARPDGETGCWIWTGYLNDSGYGMAGVRQGLFRATRLAYEVFIGPIPDGLHILHDPVRCNNRACISPHHMRCGTHYENMMDRVVSGTLQHGEDHYRTTLTDDDIREIRRLYIDEHVKQDEIGARFDISYVTISDICRGKTWKHVDTDTYVPTKDGRQKLTEEDARMIIHLHRQGLTAEAIAGRLGGLVTKSNIYNICAGRSKIWRHLLN